MSSDNTPTAPAPEAVDGPDHYPLTDAELDHSLHSDAGRKQLAAGIATAQRGVLEAQKALAELTAVYDVEYVEGRNYAALLHHLQAADCALRAVDALNPCDAQGDPK